MTAAHTFETAVAVARDTDDVVLRVEAALRYEDASWRPGLPGVGCARSAPRSHRRSRCGPRRRSADRARDRTPGPPRRGHAARPRDVGTQRRGERCVRSRPDSLPNELGSPDVEANVLSVYVGQVMFYEGAEEAEDMVHRLAELEPLIDDGDVALHAIHDRILYATLTGRFDERHRLVRTMAELQERSHSSFWEFIRANQEAMEAFYRGDLEASEMLAERCLELAERPARGGRWRHLWAAHVLDPARAGSARGDGADDPSRARQRRRRRDLDAGLGAVARRDRRQRRGSRSARASPGNRLRSPTRRDVEHGDGVDDRDDGATRRRRGVHRAASSVRGPGRHERHDRIRSAVLRTGRALSRHAVAA